MYIHTIDIAHPPLTANAAETVLNDEWQRVRSTKDYHALKIVHGYGSPERPGILKEVVHNWTYRNRSKLLAVIPGEEYNMFNTSTIEMRKACGQIHDSDLGVSNPGITIVWIK